MAREYRHVGSKRHLYRIGVARPGIVRRGEDIASCEVCDLTEKGVQLKTDLPVKVGDRLHLDCSLAETLDVRCAVRVTRTCGPSVGACIVEITAADQECLSRFIENVIALTLEGC